MTTAAKRRGRPLVIDPANAALMLAAGRTQKQAGRALGVSESAVGYHARQTPRIIQIPLTPEQAEKLRRAAVKYGREPDELAASILSIVIADDLFAAVIG